MKSITTREMLVWAGIIVVAGVISYAATRNHDHPEMTGVAAPQVSGLDENGAAVDLGPKKDKVTVLNLYANWCPPCKKEIPEFSAYYSQIKNNDDVELIGVVFESGAPKKAIPEARRLGVDYPIVVGTQEASLAYAVHSYPTTVVIGPDGFIRARVEGMLDVPALQDLVAAAQER
jgi:thiol-disulfide isomerase/thioredoxin